MRSSDRDRLAGPQLLANSAGHQLAEHGVQPAHRLGAQPAEVVVAARPDPHHRRCDPRRRAPAASWARSAATATERASFWSFLLICPVSSSRTRAASLGGTSSDLFAGGDQLLREQMPQPARALDRPRPLRPATRPSSAAPRPARPMPAPAAAPAASRAHRSRTAVCDPLCGSIPIITPAIVVTSTQDQPAGRPRRARLNSGRHRRARLFRATPRARHDGPAPRSQARPDRSADGSGASPSHLHGRYDQVERPLTKFQSDGSRAHRTAGQP